MTDCNGCGDCCDPVAIVFTQEFVRSLDPKSRREIVGKRSTRWILEELVPIDREVGLAESPHLTTGETTFTIEGLGDVKVGTHFYRCLNFDTETRQCRAYDDRPPECAGYPWYEATPDAYDEELKERTPLPARCSYNADLGRPVAVERPRRHPRHAHRPQPGRLLPPHGVSVLPPP